MLGARAGRSGRDHRQPDRASRRRSAWPPRPRSRPQFEESVAFSGLTAARRGALRRRRHRVRRREARHRQALLRARRRDARHRRRRPRRRRTTTGTAGLIGLAVDPGYPARPYVYVSYTWDHLARWADDCPTPPGRDGRRAASSTAGSRASTSTTARRPCCSAASGASSSRATASAASPSAADGALYASAGDGASFNYADERPTAGRPGNPCSDPARQGGSLRAQDLRTARRPGEPRRLDPAAEPGHGRGGRRQPARRRPGRRRAPDRRPGPAQPVPHRDPPGHERAVGGRRRLERVGGDQPLHRPGGRARAATSAGRATRARRASGSWDQLDNPVCEGLYGAAGGAVTAPYYAYRPRRQGRRERELPDGHVLDLRRWSSTTAGRSRPSTTARCSSPTTRATAPGRCCAARTGCPTRRGSGRSSPASPVVDLQVGPGGALFFVDIERHGPPDPGARRQPGPDRAGDRDARPRARAAQRRARRARLDRSRRRHARPTPGTSTATARTTTAPPPRRVRAYTAPTAVGLRVRDSSGLEDFAQVRVDARASRPARRSPRPAAGTTWAVGDRIAFSGGGTSRDRRGAARERARPGSCGCTTARSPAATCIPIQTWAGTASGDHRRARPRVPVVPRAAADRDRGRPDARPSRAGWTRAPSR